jgi:hypothetical protein
MKPTSKIEVDSLSFRQLCDILDRPRPQSSQKGERRHSPAFHRCLKRYLDIRVGAGYGVEWASRVAKTDELARLDEWKMRLGEDGFDRFIDSDGDPYGVLVDVIFDDKGDAYAFWAQWENPAEYPGRDFLRGFARNAVLTRVPV